ncbi:MAG: hypothetical protein ACOX42_08310 [Clostridia bacterium]|jgi:hypothetical protein
MVKINNWGYKEPFYKYYTVGYCPGGVICVIVIGIIVYIVTALFTLVGLTLQLDILLQMGLYRG